MVRERIRGAPGVGAMLQRLGDGIEHGDIHVADKKFHVGRNVVAVVDAYPATRELLIVVCGVDQVEAPKPAEPKPERELAYAAN